MIGSLATFLGVAAYGVLHSLLATLWAKRRAEAALGPAGSRFYRLSYNLFALISLAPVLAIPALHPGKTLYRLSGLWEALAFVGQALALLLLAAGVFQTDVRHFLGIRQLSQGESNPPRLVATGLYRWVRHPLYAAGLAFLWLTPILTLNMLVLNLGLTLYVLIGTHFEERRLLAEFGAAYASYQHQVPRLIPLPWRRLRRS